MDTREQAIVIRQAQVEDSEKIWDILHANCRTWAINRIHENIEGMYVLTKGKMLGVLFGSFSLEKLKVEWVEIHPLYSEKILKDVFIKGVLGTLQPDIESYVLQKALNQQLSPIWGC